MQGFNMGRYVPPEHEGVLSGNQLHKKRPPGQHGSTLTVRFEMPFNIVCCHCEGHIAQGVRFNAEKTKVGNYYSTPIWAFKMKHTVCSGVIVIRTDPKNTAYLVAEGGRKQHEMAESEPGAVIKVRGDEEGEGVMEKLEKQSKEKRRVKEAAPRIEELWRLRERQWADPYEHSKKMRKIFRTERKRLQTQAANTAALQDKLSLGINLLPESEEDAIAAKMIDFGEAPIDGDIGDKVREILVGKAMFEDEEGRHRDWQKEREYRKEVGMKGMTRAQLQAEEARIGLGNELRKNTRTRMDPFWNGLADSGNSGSGGSIGTGGVVAGSRESTPPRVLAGLKRKKAVASSHPATTSRSADDFAETPPPAAVKITGTNTNPIAMLVDYDSSDSD